MKLVCPHCSAVVEVADSLAGQTSKCHACGGPFTVPNVSPDVLNVLGSSPPPPPPPPTPPSPSDLARVDQEPPKASAASEGGRSTDAPESPQSTSSTTEPDWVMPDVTHRPAGWRFQMRCKPEVLYWVTPAAVTLLFFLSFFTWEGIYFGQEALAEQSGMGMAFGSLSVAPSIKGMERTSSGPMLLLYFLLSFVGFLAAAGLLFLRFGPADLRKKLGDWPDRLLPHRTLVMMVVGVGCFLMLLFHTLLPFPLETDFRGDVVVNVLSEGTGLKAGTPESRAKVAQLGSSQLVQRSIWWKIAWLAGLAAAGASFLDWWGHRRHYKTWPSLEVVCHPGAASK